MSTGTRKTFISQSRFHIEERVGGGGGCTHPYDPIGVRLSGILVNVKAEASDLHIFLSRLTIQ